MRTPKIEKHPELVYGAIHQNSREISLVFIPKEKAVILQRIDRALDKASTWGKFRALMPRGAYRELVNEWMTFREYCESEGTSSRKKLSPGQREELLAEFQEIPTGERLPLDDEPFECDIPAVCDG